MYWPGKIPAKVECDEIAASLDFYTTFASLAGADVPRDRVIDGIDISSLMFGQKGVVSPRKGFFYYWLNNLEAVRNGKWKLHVRKGGKEVRELYDLDADIGESCNLYEQCPDVVKQLGIYLKECREDLGDEAAGINGENTRPIGEVQNAQPLTEYNPDHPYIIAMYDKEDAG